MSGEVSPADVEAIVKNKPIYHKVCPVCGKHFTSTARHTKYCGSESCLKFAQKKVGKLRKRRAKRNLNVAFHRDWVRKHRADREAYIAEHAIIYCEGCGKQLKLSEIEIHHANGNYLDGYASGKKENCRGLCKACHTKEESVLRKTGVVIAEAPQEA